MAHFEDSEGKKAGLHSMKEKIKIDRKNLPLLRRCCPKNKLFLFWDTLPTTG
jgi:hypothetical protein